MPTMDHSALEALLEDLLRREPPAVVVAISADGHFVDMPASVPLTGHRQVDGGSSALDVVVADDMRAVVEAWAATMASGHGTCRVRPAVAPGLQVGLEFVDVRHAHGVIIGAFHGVPTGTVPARHGGAAVLRPRHGSVRKDEYALILDADDAALAMLGFAADDMVGHRSLEFVHPDDHGPALGSWMDMRGTPGAVRRVRLRHRRADGAWGWFEITNHNRLADAAYGCVITEMTDISEEMAAVEALRASEELLRRLAEALPVGVVQVDGDAGVVYRNDRAVAVLGQPVEVGESMSDPALADAVAMVLGTGEDVDVEVALGAGAGIRRVRATVRVLHAADGSVSGAIACLDDVTDAAALREELAHRATYDQLTGCLTRRAVLERLQGLVDAQVPVAVLFVDLDGFKAVNDRYGHAAGDALLRHVGAGLLAAAGPGALVGRVGGDEFLIAASRGAHDSAAALRSACLTAIEQPLDTGGLVLRASASIGVSVSVVGADADSLVALADAAMYEEKSTRSRPPRARVPHGA